MAEQITILYTQNLRGRLEALPRITTLIKKRRREIDNKVLLLDMGASCHPSVKLCQQTDGRASLILLDAIGYDAAVVTGFLTDAGRHKLGNNYLRLALVDDNNPYQHEGIAMSHSALTTRDAKLHIVMHTSEETRLTPETSYGFIYSLHLREIEGGQVGHVTVAINDVRTHIVTSGISRLSPDIMPDPTIAGTLDFVRQEARFYSSRRGNRPQGDASFVSW